MQESSASASEIRQPAVITRPRFLFLPRNLTLLFLAIIIGAALVFASFTFVSRLPHIAAPEVSQTTILNGATRWQNDNKTTAPTFDFSSPGINTQDIAVSPLFADYYSSHRGTASPGKAVTVAFSTNQGWIQFFQYGALLVPSSQLEQPDGANDPLTTLIASGMKDSATGIVRLPLLQALLTVGSQVPVSGNGGSFTYADLRKATAAELMVPAPASTTPATSEGVFIKGGTRAGMVVGHVVPRSIWNYITRTDISPDGWQADFGAPLTEALTFSITKDGHVHHMLVQGFWRDGVILDEDSKDAAGQPLIERLETGVAYLRTVGPPAVAVQAQQTIWVQSDTALLATAGTGSAVAHPEENFPLTLLGETTWNMQMLWYHVQWGVPKQRQTGWASAAAITFRSPGNMPGRASIDALSSELATYLASIGPNVNAVVYDVTHQQYYTYNANAQFIMGSSMKVPIMLTFFDMIERQGREPTDREIQLLTTMIENSNNDSASALYYGEIGGAQGVARYLQSIHITDLQPNPNAWGYSLVTPQAMVQMLTDLYKGTILTARHRQMAFYWMEHIESDQQVGVGDTAPDGTTVAMKDGWLPGPDDLWAMNSSGIVTQGQETYIISVYTHEQASLGDGQAIARRVCRTVAQLLLS
jgi:beta-lactamase class A